MPEDEPLSARFASTVEQLGVDGSIIDRCCEAARRMLGADGVALTINHHRPDRHTLSATTMLATVLENAQDIAGEGPAFDASRSCEVVHVPSNSSARSRWPLLTDALGGFGFTGCLAAIPLTVGDRSIGVMTAHRTDAEATFDHAVTRFLASTLGAVLTERLMLETLEQEFTADWTSRALIYQAAGMVVAQMRVEPSSAWSLLRTHACSHDQALVDVAAQIIERKLTFGPNHAWQG